MGAEFMQPGLVQLQPNLDDFMDTFEPLQGLSQIFCSQIFFNKTFLEFFFSSKNMSSLPTLPEEPNVENTASNIAQQNSKMNQSVSCLNEL